MPSAHPSCGRWRRPGHGAHIGQRIVHALTLAPVQIFLIVVGLLWLVPTFGLLITSLMSPSDVAAGGWWQVLSEPSKLTFENYQTVLDDPDITSALITTVWVAIGSTVLPLIIAALAGYAFAWIDFPGRDWLFIAGDRAAGRAAADGADPDLLALQQPRDLRHGDRPDPVPHRVRAAVRDLPAEELLHRDPEGTAGSGTHRRSRRVQASSSGSILPLGLPAIASLAIFQFLWTWNDLLVALTFGAQHAADHRGDLLRRSASSASNIEMIAPAAFLSLIVPLIVFFAFQRYFVQGLLAGSVK